MSYSGMQDALHQAAVDQIAVEAPRPVPAADAAGEDIAAASPAAPTDAEWHDWRRQGIGGSDIAALIGLSAYASPTSLYYEKLGMLEDRTADTPRQRIGKRMQSVLAAEFTDVTGLAVVGEQMWCMHPEFEWARCTTDGFAAESMSTDVDMDAVLGTVEFKTDGRFGWPDGVPANIRAQCIWQMGVTGAQYCWVVVMFAGFRVEVFEIDRDEEAQSDWLFMLATADEFWNEHVLTGNPPPVDDHQATTEALTEVHHDPDGYLDADDGARALVAAVQSAQATTKAAKAEEDRAKNELRALLGDHTELVDGWLMKIRQKARPVVIASWREQQTSKTDMDGLRAEAPELVAKYTTKSTVRVLRVGKPKED